MAHLAEQLVAWRERVPLALLVIDVDRRITIDRLFGRDAGAAVQHASASLI
jgi:hypothetical protein